MYIFIFQNYHLTMYLFIETCMEDGSTGSMYNYSIS